MSALDELRKCFRSGTTRIDLDHAELLLPNVAPVPLGVPAFILLQDHRLILKLRASEPMKLSPVLLSLFARDASGRVLTSTDYLVIHALTDKGVPVRLEDVVPRFSDESSNFVNRGGAVTHREVAFHKLTILPMGTEGLTPAERRAEQLALGVIKPDESPVLSEDVEEGFSALIPNVKLKLINSGGTTTTKHPFHRHDGFSGDTRCFTGKILGGEYCLEQTEEGDLAIGYRRTHRPSAATIPIKRVFEALAAAVGLLHSCNPWPYYYSHWHDGKLIERWLKAPTDCQRDCLEPTHVSILENNAAQLFDTATEFFATGSEEADYYRRALWLMREACRKGAAFEVRLLTLCSVLEGVAKRNLNLDRLDSLAKWEDSIMKTGLPWSGWFDQVRDSYYEYRNNLAHGFDPHPSEEREPDMVFNAYSRITAGIYILMAKRIGFTGTLWRSRLEGNATLSLGSSTAP